MYDILYLLQLKCRGDLKERRLELRNSLYFSFQRLSCCLSEIMSQNDDLQGIKNDFIYQIRCVN